ncbi:hypothetical protein [Taibaiella koreensis]|uniref:hypothetical protein n=1 Tax=Taibaiella koreensis TaxID=1268548 RepID=UPI000E59DB31|nr:hypothetical protein [Taibaiella koreensis]
MTRNFFSSLILWILCSFLVFFCFIIAASAQGTKARPAHIGFTYPLSTNGSEAPQLTNNFSMHVLAGVSWQENAFCLSGISSIVRHEAHGVLISGILNRVQHKADGVQIAGVLNQIKGDAKGAQLAGIANISGSSDGAQIAGLTNITKEANGLQLAGFANKAANSDAQVAGFANIARNSNAAQVAGFINVAKDAHTQVAGFINVAKKVSGVQVAGFINIAEESNYPIGIINIIKNGEKQIGVSVDETSSTLINFRSGGKVLYGIVGAGYNFKDDVARYVLEVGLGAHIAISKPFRINLETVTMAMSDLQHDVYMKSAIRVLPAYKIANRLEFFAGPSFNHLSYERGQTDIRDDHYLWKNRGRNHVNGLYFGGVVGVQINL